MGYPMPIIDIVTKYVPLPDIASTKNSTLEAPPAAQEHLDIVSPTSGTKVYVSYTLFVLGTFLCYVCSKITKKLLKTMR